MLMYLLLEVRMPLQSASRKVEYLRIGNADRGNERAHLPLPMDRVSAGRPGDEARSRNIIN